MKYLQELGLAGLLALSGCKMKVEHKPYEPYEGEIVFRVREEKLEDNLWVQVVESERRDIDNDIRYKIFLTNDTGEKYNFLLGVNSEADCRSIKGFNGYLSNTEIVTPEGKKKNLCDYFPK